ncbi:MAG: VOC family protein [Alphaproteobacteria bacterium]|nr:VOC family protein [Alphaproteobacteria bacterium]
MNIIGVDGVVYGVEELDRCIDFWNDFGLVKQSADENGAVFATADGALIEVRSIDDPTLPPAAETGPTAREVYWGVDTPQTLDAIADEIGKDQPIARDDDGTVHTIDPGGYAIGFRISSVTELPVEPTTYNAPGASTRVDQPGPIYKKAQPSHLAHVVFRTPDLAPMLDFYTGKLGFQLSDSYPDRGYFLRAGLSEEHHNLFFFNPDGSKGFHHAAFNVRDIHEVFGGGLHMTNKGWKTHIGPGRHPISSAYFWYFHNPNGGAAEYDFDSDVVTDAWQPREFEPSPDAFAEWALEGGIERYTGIQTARS